MRYPRIKVEEQVLSLVYNEFEIWPEELKVIKLNLDLDHEEEVTWRNQSYSTNSRFNSSARSGTKNWKFVPKIS